MTRPKRSKIGRSSLSEAERRIAMAFRFRPEIVAALRVLAARWRVSQAAALERLVAEAR